MKVLKVLLIIVAIVVAIGLVLGLMAPKEFSMSREIEIDASQETVWAAISSLEAQNQWSPWMDKDPNMTREMRGEPNGIGSIYYWSGNEEVGEGEQEITAIDPMNSVSMDLRFLSPYESQAKVVMSVEESDGMQKATWSFSTSFDFITSIFMMMGDMEAMLAPDFEKGLANLKELCESAPKSTTGDDMVEVDGHMISTKDYGPRHYVGVRQVVEWSNIKQFFEDNFGATMGAIMAAGHQPAGVPSAIYYEWNEETQTADMVAAIPVESGDIAIEGMETFSFDPSPSYQIDFYGPYEESGQAHEALDKHMNETKMTLSLGVVVEEYVTDPSTEPDQSKWLTRVIYPVAPASADEGSADTAE